MEGVLCVSLARTPPPAGMDGILCVSVARNTPPPARMEGVLCVSLCVHQKLISDISNTGEVMGLGVNAELAQWMCTWSSNFPLKGLWVQGSNYFFFFFF